MKSPGQTRGRPKTNWTKQFMFVCLFLAQAEFSWAWLLANLSGTKIASQNRSDHGGRKRARDHSAAEIAGFFASPAAEKRPLAASDFGG